MERKKSFSDNQLPSLKGHPSIKVSQFLEKNDTFLHQKGKGEITLFEVSSKIKKGGFAEQQDIVVSR